MRTETVTYEVYKFSELSERAKHNAVAKLATINVDHDWWESVFEDAKQIGAEILEFDIDRGNSIKIRLTQSEESVAKAIQREHGQTCDTYKLAERFLLTCTTAWEDFEFTKALGEEYLHMLRAEYEHLTSFESVVDTIEANEYEFHADGRMY